MRKPEVLCTYWTDDVFGSDGKQKVDMQNKVYK